MKKIVLLIITLFLTAQTIKAQTVVLDTNGVTVKWTGTTVIFYNRLITTYPLFKELVDTFDLIIE